MRTTIPSKKSPALAGVFLFDFAEFAVDGAEFFVKAVFGFVEGEVVGAGVVALEAAEGFFVLGEAVPGVVFVFASRDAPEIVVFFTGPFSVENHLDQDYRACHEVSMFKVGGGVHVEAGVGRVVDEGGGDGGFFWGGFVLEFGDVEGGEAGFELVFEVLGGLGVEVVFFSEGF